MKQSERDKHNAKFGQWPRENPRRGKSDWEISLLFLNNAISDLQSFISKNAPPQKITEPKNTSKTVPKQQTDLPQALCLYETVRIRLHDCTESVRTCTELSVPLYGTVRNSSVRMYGSVRTLYGPYGQIVRTVQTEKFWKSETLFLFEKRVDSRNLCRNYFFSKTVQKICFGLHSSW